MEVWQLSIFTPTPVKRWAAQKMQTPTYAIAIETVDAKVKPVISLPLNPMYPHRNEDDGTKATRCQTQNHPLNSGQPWDPSWNNDLSYPYSLNWTDLNPEPITMACSSLKTNWAWRLKTTRLPKLVLLLYRIHTSLQPTNTSLTKSIPGSQCHAFPQFRLCRPRALLCTLKIVTLPYPVLLRSLFRCQLLHIRYKGSHQLSMTFSDPPNINWLWIIIDTRLITNHARQRLWSSQYMHLWARTFFSLILSFPSNFVSFDGLELPLTLRQSGGITSTFQKPRISANPLVAYKRVPQEADITAKILPTSFRWNVDMIVTNIRIREGRNPTGILLNHTCLSQVCRCLFVASFSRVGWPVWPWRITGCLFSNSKK